MRGWLARGSLAGVDATRLAQTRVKTSVYAIAVPDGLRHLIAAAFCRGVQAHHRKKCSRTIRSDAVMS